MANEPKNNLQPQPYRTPEVPQSFGTFHWRTIIAGLTMIFIANLIATQFIAARFYYSAALGKPLIPLGRGGIYAPWLWMLWFLRYTRSAVPYVKNTVGYAILLVVVLSLLGGFYVFIINFKRSRKLLEGNEDLHGSARFATKEELIQNGILTCPKGVYIGGYNDGKFIHYIKEDSKEHILAFAPTRSGKGIGLVIPTLLGWNESTIVYDLKGENWALTSGFRSKELGHTCLKFAPLEKETAHINPFDGLRFGTTHEVSDARKLAEMLIDTGDSKDDEKSYFVKQAITLGTALILHLFYEGREKGYATPSPANLLDIATDPVYGLRKVMQILQTYPHRDPAKYQADPADTVNQPFPGIRDETLTTHPTVASTMAAMLMKGDREFGSILGSLTEPLQVYADPLVRDAVAYSDFRIADLVQEKISLYLVIPNPDKERLKPLVRSIFSLALYKLTDHMDFNKAQMVKNPYRLLFLIDEFPSLGKMEIMESSLALMGGFGLKGYFIVQDLEQLYKYYGQHENITSNCRVRIAYAPNNQATAEKLSQMTGKRTIRHGTVSYSGARTSSAQNQMTTSIQLVERELMTADEVSNLKPIQVENPGRDDERATGPGEMLIFIRGQRPIFGTQIIYFLDQEFSRRAEIPAPAADSASEYRAPTLPERPRAMVLPMIPAATGDPASNTIVLPEIAIPAAANHAHLNNARIEQVQQGIANDVIYSHAPSGDYASADESHLVDEENDG